MLGKRKAMNKMLGAAIVLLLAFLWDAIFSLGSLVYAVIFAGQHQWMYMAVALILAQVTSTDARVKMLTAKKDMKRWRKILNKISRKQDKMLADLKADIESNFGRR